MPPVRCRYCGELRGSGWSHCLGPTGDHEFYEQRPCAAAGCTRRTMWRSDIPRVYCMLHECHAVGCFARVTQTEHSVDTLHCAQHLGARQALGRAKE